MNTLHVATVLTIALLALPIYAQQGPAGVPGVVELLVESVTPVIADEPVKPPPAISPKLPPVEAARSEIKMERVQTVPNKPHKVGKKPRKPMPKNCIQAKDPARCELFEKARKTCQPSIGDAHRRCLREVLTSKQ